MCRTKNNNKSSCASCRHSLCQRKRTVSAMTYYDATNWMPLIAISFFIMAKTVYININFSPARMRKHSQHWQNSPIIHTVYKIDDIIINWIENSWNPISTATFGWRTIFIQFSINDISSAVSLVYISNLMTIRNEIFIEIPFFWGQRELWFTFQDLYFLF